MHRAGYRYVTLDLDGFRSGNLNQALPSMPPSQPFRRCGRKADRGHGVGAGTGESTVIRVRVKLTFPDELVREP